MASPKEQAWLDYYFGEAYFNATEAARLSGYAHPNKQGPRKLKKFAEEIQERLNREIMTADEALRHMSRIARAPQAKHMTALGPEMKEVIDDGYSDLIKKVKRHANGNIEVEFYDRQAALDTILKVHKRLKNHLEVGVTFKGYDDVLLEVYGDDGPKEEAEESGGA